MKGNELKGFRGDECYLSSVVRIKDGDTVSLLAGEKSRERISPFALVE
jgi:hypothetical protein